MDASFAAFTWFFLCILLVHVEGCKAPRETCGWDLHSFGERLLQIHGTRAALCKLKENIYIYIYVYLCVYKYK